MTILEHARLNGLYSLKRSLLGIKKEHTRFEGSASEKLLLDVEKDIENAIKDFDISPLLGDGIEGHRSL